MTKTKRAIFSLLLSLIVLISALVFPASITHVSAEENVVSAFEERNVLDDLNGAVIGGEEFDLKDYPYNPFGRPQLIYFAEFGYSVKEDKQSDYGLYVYVYNPQEIALDVDTARNKIQFTYGDKESYLKYSLNFLNYSDEPGYEGRFYKFKVCLYDPERLDILNAVDYNGRVYKISGIELSYKGEVTEYSVAQTYTYTGFAKGYGSELATGDTVSAQVDGFGNCLYLDVHTTYYRPEGTNGKNDYTQDSLHSAYFAVPKDILAEFDMISAIHATWLDAVLAPVLVTGHEEAYKAISRYLGIDLNTVAGNDSGGNIEDMGYLYLGGLTYKPFEDGGYDQYWYGYSYNFSSTHSSFFSHELYGDYVNPLYWLFYSGDGENSADEYMIPSEKLETRLEELTLKYGGELVNDRYSRVLFDSVASEFVDLNIIADTKYDLRSEIISSTWWEKLWGQTHLESSEIFDGIDAIYAVSENDFIYLDDELDISATCDKLYIAEADFPEFERFYNKNKEDSVVYLLRYQITDYVAQEASRLEWNGRNWVEQDTNAYFMQETINLDFDVIDVTFAKGVVSTILPVIASPVDNIPDGTPPVRTEDDRDWLKLLFAILALIVVLVILAPLLPYILKFIGWILLLPFRLISWIISLFTKKNE